MSGILPRFSVAALLVGAAAFAGWANEPSTSVSEHLIRSIEQLGQQPPDPQQAVQLARDRLQGSIQRLEKMLAGGREENAQRWAAWLELPTLKQQAAATEADLAILSSIHERLHQNHAGLDLPVFQELRRDLHAFAVAQEYSRQHSPERYFRQQLVQLNECLQRLSVQPAYADSHAAGLIVGWLQSLDERGAAVAKDVRAEFCQTNAVAQASARLANVLFQRGVSERNYITEVVMGSNMRGVALMEGQLWLGMAPSAERGTLEICLQGNVRCPSNVADKRRVSVFSSTYTTLDAKKRVFIDDQGLRVAPASAVCATSVGIQDIEAPRVVERLAWRRVSRMMPEAEAMTSRRAESQTASSLDQQADTSLLKINSAFCEKLRAPLIRFNALPAQMRVWTDATHLHLSLRQQNESQLAAAGCAPLLSKDCDIGGAVHESMINNLAEPLLGGKIIDDEAWLEIVHVLLGAPPRALWVHDRTERWAVRFAKELPIVIRFDENRLGMQFQLAEVLQGQQIFRQPVTIAAEFRLGITPEGPTLYSEGDLAVEIGKSANPEEDELLREFVRRKFGAILQPVVAFNGLSPPAGGALGKLRQLVPVEFQTSAGWIKLTYTLTPDQFQTPSEPVIPTTPPPERSASLSSAVR